MTMGESPRQMMLGMVQRFSKTTEKPPLNEEQLVILALLLDRRTTSSKDLFEWALGNFPYYDRLAREAFWYHPFFDSGLYLTSSIRFRGNFEEALSRYESPLSTRTGDNNGIVYEISDVDGHDHLASALGHVTPKQTVSFFKLPAEIRNSIYEYTFRYPDSGIVVLRTKTHYVDKHIDGYRHLGFLSRFIEDEFRFAKWPSELKCTTMNYAQPVKGLLYTKPLKSILAVLLVNRQFFEEAMPIFYGINRFWFGSLGHLASVLRGLAPGRRKHIKHVSFIFYRDSGAAGALKALSQLDNLSNLDVSFYLDNKQSTEQVNHPSGLHTLCKIRGLEEVTVERAGQQLESFVKESLLRPVEALGTGRKRKRKASKNMDSHTTTTSDDSD